MEMSRKKKMEVRIDIYAQITKRIVAQLAKGVRPWVLYPWSTGNAAARITRPLRHECASAVGGSRAGLCYADLDDVQAARRAWRPCQKRRNQHHGHLCQSVHQDGTDARGDEVEHDIPFLRAYGVFNVEQIEGAYPSTTITARRLSPIRLNGSKAPTASSPMPAPSFAMAGHEPITHQSPIISRCRPLTSPSRA